MSRSSDLGGSGRCTAGSTLSKPGPRTLTRCSPRRPSRRRTWRPKSSRLPRRTFEKQVDAVQAHAEWDERTKEIQLANIQRIAQRRLDVAKTDHRRQEARRDSRGEGRVGACRFAASATSCGSRRRSFHRCPRSSWDSSSGSGGGRSRTWEPIPSGWCTTRGRLGPPPKS